jgi:hypothetical protein
LLWSFAYFVVRNLFALAWLLARPRQSKELEILVLRDETLLRWLRRLLARRWRFAHRAPGRPPLESSLRRTTLVLSGRDSDAVGARVEALLVS